MILELEVTQVEELGATLEVTLRELSHEIAATDNASYRHELMIRRERLAATRDEIARKLSPAPELPHELVRELARPGD